MMNPVNNRVHFRGTQMKIAIIGYSGSGKSTLARELAEAYQLPVLHLDQVQFLPGWKERTTEEQCEIVYNFMNEYPSWVIDGNYSRVCYAERMEQADLIIELLFNRFTCLNRVRKRYIRYKGQSRPDMTEDCNEKLDGEFIRWILFDGRTKKHRKRYRSIQNLYPDKVIVLRNQKQIDQYLLSLKE